jgi:hypothetical protein
MRFADDADPAVRPITRLRPDRDVDILAERPQQAHQALAGEVREPSVEECRYLRLVDAHESRRREIKLSVPVGRFGEPEKIAA